MEKAAVLGNWFSGEKNEGMINDEAKFQGRRAQGACLLTLAKPTAMHNGTLYRMFREATHIRWGWGVAQLAHANMWKPMLRFVAHIHL